MFRIFLFALCLFSAWRWGDWKNFNKYYPTILYFIICSLLYSILFEHHPLWRFDPVPPLNNILFNNKIIALVNTFFIFSATGLIYLSNYPNGNKQYLYIVLWVVIYAAIELIAKYENGISYYNGWNLGWSIFFNFLIFSFLRLHYLRPMLTWILSPLVIIFIFVVFRIPVQIIN